MRTRCFGAVLWVAGMATACGQAAGAPGASDVPVVEDATTGSSAGTWGHTALSGPPAREASTGRGPGGVSQDSGVEAHATSLRAPPLAEYLINEAGPGEAAGWLRDTRPDPADLTIVYASGSPLFAEDEHGRALSFPAGDVRFAGAFSEPLDEGHKLRDVLHGTTRATLEVLADVDWARDPATIFHIFGVIQENGENDDLALWRWADRLVFDFTASAEPGNARGHYYQRSVPLAAVTPGPHVFHVVLDTEAASPEDRLRLYLDGRRQSASVPSSGSEIARGEHLAIPRPHHSFDEAAEAEDSTHHQLLSLGGIANYAAGTGGFRGRIYYAAVHGDALTDDEIRSAPARIGRGD